MFKYILSVLLSTVMLQATTIQTQAHNIDNNAKVIVSVTDMPRDNRDWVAIYPVGAKSTFANIVSYKYTGGVAAGDFDLGTVPTGNYEARAFAGHSWHASASYTFSVRGQAVNPTVTTSKETFNTNEAVTVSIANMPGDDHDWVAIYPVGARNTFANIVSYKYTNGAKAGNFNLGTIPSGNYEARAFYANSWRVRASHAFSVEGENITPTITTSKDTYTSTEAVTVSIANMPGDNHDWVAIYPVGARNTFANIVVYAYTDGIKNGNIPLGGVLAGNYEARVFYANSWRVRASHAFSVTQNNGHIVPYNQLKDYDFTHNLSNIIIENKSIHLKYPDKFLQYVIDVNNGWDTGDNMSDRAAKITRGMVIIGDSTVASYPIVNKRDKGGWGEFLPFYFTKGEISNFAISGRSSKSFYNEVGAWDEAYKKLKSGDLLLIQFGHNDTSVEAKGTTIEEYKGYLRKYISEAKVKGAHPILVSPMHIMRFNVDGTLTQSLKEYETAMREVAEEQHINFINLYALSARLFESLGRENIKFLADSVPNGVHFSKIGASLLSALVADEIVDLYN